MTSLESALQRITDLGRSEPRFTRDADFAVAVSGDAEAERLIRGLRAQGYEVTALVEQELLPGLRMKVARIEHLIALKVLSRDDVQRPQDLVDRRALLRVELSP